MTPESTRHEPTTFIDMLTLGMWAANCYVIGDTDRGTAFVVDPGQDGAEPVAQALADRGVTCEAILLTHAHIDHLWSAPELARSLDVGVRMHEADRWLWDEPGAGIGAPPGALEAQFGLVWDPPDDRLETFTDDQTMTVAGFKITTRHTPGHTPGSTVFTSDDIADEPVMISGDLIFAGSVGRTDFLRSSWDDQCSSIHRVVLPQPDEMRIISGHGPETTIGRERRSNPFVQQIMAELGSPEPGHGGSVGPDTGPRAIGDVRRTGL